MSDDLSAVLVTVPSVMGEVDTGSFLEMQLVRYVIEGGTIVLLWPYGLLQDHDFFERAFGLPWKPGSDFCTTFYLNTLVAADRFKKRAMPPSYRMRAQRIARACLLSQVYVAGIQSMDKFYNRRYNAKILLMDDTQSPVVFTQL
jgi:hypothetical protein